MTTTHPQHPSDEEIGEFIGLFYTRDEWASRVVDAGFTMALVRAALDKWGQPAPKVEALTEEEPAP